MTQNLGCHTCARRDLAEAIVDVATILRLTGAIYDAPLIGDWRPSLELVHDMLDCTHVVLMTHDIRIGQQIPVGGRDRGIETKYIEQYMPLNDGWPVLARQNVGTAVLDRHALDMERWESSVFYNEFARANGMVTVSGVVFRRDHVAVSGLAVNHGAREDEFERRDLELLSAVWPHFQRAQQLWQARPALAAGDLSLWEAVDRLSTGVIIMDRTGRILQANAMASELLRRCSGQLLQRQPYAGADRLQAGILGALISSLTSGAPGQGAGCHRLDTEDRAYMLTILPLQGPPDWVGTRRTCYAMLMADLTTAPVDAGAALIAIFGLTRAEARLAVRLGEEGPLSDLAASLDLRLSTAKTLFARALAKTGVHSQSQLVRLVERLSIVRRPSVE
jgi:DNA-binding CsgD family transcriptional regulator/PAS domain-containing protein